MVEIRFHLPDVPGNPFDYSDNDVIATIRQPDGKEAPLPAFFDGGSTWRVRFTPSQTGEHKVAGITRNGQPVQPQRLSRSAFTVKEPRGPGFVRRDPNDHARFITDDGKAYYPIGHNTAWDADGLVTVESALNRMGEAGENWSRIWMCHWDGKNLDWVQEKKIPLGRLSLEVARRWDSVVRAAERNDIRFQMVLQHHGPYSAETDSNWLEHPWNKANGGFLAKPEEFFTSERAIALTKAKFRYIIARWGYSPSIMAWELFNEVQWTNAARLNPKTTARWHDEMADFVRKQDPYRHLVTSSMGVYPELLGDRLDYWQPHIYTADPISIASRLNGQKFDRPVFLGEVGPKGRFQADDASFMRDVLWASLMSEAAGAAQNWAWPVVHAQKLYGMYRSATGFVSWCGLAEKRGLKSITVEVETSERGPLTFGPGGEWEAAKETAYAVPPSGNMAARGWLPRYLQGDGNRHLFPYADFDVTFDQPGTFSLRIAEVSAAGARVVISLDGKPAAVRSFPRSAEDRKEEATIDLPVPAGQHVIRMENTGGGWLTYRSVTLNPYGYRLGAVGKGTRDFAVCWVHNRADSATEGTLILHDMDPGRYRVRWWDTKKGEPGREDFVTVESDGTLKAQTPSIERDAAVWMAREAKP